MGYFKVESWKDVLLFIPKLIHALWNELIVNLVKYLGEIGIYIFAFFFLFNNIIGIDVSLSGTLSLLFGLPLSIFLIYILGEIDDEYKSHQ